MRHKQYKLLGFLLGLFGFFAASVKTGSGCSKGIKSFQRKLECFITLKMIYKMANHKIHMFMFCFHILQSRCLC